MSHIEMAGLSRKERFRLISGSVQPRPIALVTTLNGDGSCNAAPFSAFNYMSDEPPIAALGIDRYGDESQGREGEIKDTLRNVLERGEFVINMVDIGMLPIAVGWPRPGRLMPCRLLPSCDDRSAAPCRLPDTVE